MEPIKWLFLLILIAALGGAVILLGLILVNARLTSWLEDRLAGFAILLGALTSGAAIIVVGSEFFK